MVKLIFLGFCGVVGVDFGRGGAGLFDRTGAGVGLGGRIGCLAIPVEH